MFINEEKSIVLKISMIFILSLIFINLLTVYINYHFFSHKIKNVALANTENKILEREKFTQDYLDSLIGEIEFIRDSEAFKSYLSQNNKEYVSKLFYKFMQMNPEYMQIRYIDKSGIEKVRVQRDSIKSNPVKVFEKELQDKSNRYYFKESLKKELEKPWITPIDFNIENSLITRDITFRIVYPIKKDNTFNGILVVNIFAENFLKNLSNAPLYDITIVNNEGKILQYKGENKYL